MHPLLPKLCSIHFTYVSVFYESVIIPSCATYIYIRMLTLFCAVCMAGILAKKYITNSRPCTIRDPIVHDKHVMIVDKHFKQQWFFLLFFFFRLYHQASPQPVLHHAAQHVIFPCSSCISYFKTFTTSRVYPASCPANT